MIIQCLCAAITVVLLLNLLQGKFLYHPFPSPPTNWAHGDMVRYGDPTKRFLYFHGNAANATHQIPSKLIGQVKPCDWYTFEYPGFGTQYGKPTNHASVIRAAERALFNIATRSSPVYLVGQSLGSGVAAEIAARHPDVVRGVILITPYTRMSDVLNYYVPFSGYLTFGHRYNCIDNLRIYLETPNARALVIAARHDQVIPYEHAVQIAHECNTELVTFDGGHNCIGSHVQSWSDQLRLFTQ